MYVVEVCCDLPHAPSAISRATGDQIAVYSKSNGIIILPDKMPEINPGFLGSLGDKQGFAYIMDRAQSLVV